MTADLHNNRGETTRFGGGSAGQIVLIHPPREPSLTIDRPIAYAYPYMTIALATTADVIKAFADPMRLRILNLLIEGEVCVCDLCTVLEEIQPKVSRHLAYLRRNGLVQVRQEGKWKHYRIHREVQGLERSLIDCVKSHLRKVDVLQNDLDRLGRAHSSCGN